MGNFISIHASRSMQSFIDGRCNNVKSLISRLDKLSNKRTNIENNNYLLQKQKDIQLARIDKEMDNINTKIDNFQKKLDTKNQQKLLEQEKNNLESTMDPEDVESILIMEKLGKIAVDGDSISESSASCKKGLVIDQKV